MAFSAGILGKMTIIFYPDPDLPGVGVPFTPMYNPTTLTVNHNVLHEEQKKPLTSNASKKFINTGPRSVSMELFFDGTGASPSSLSSMIPTPSNVANLLDSVGISGFSEALNSFNSVDIQVQTFLKLGYQIAGELHQPWYMMISWGTFIMTCVLKSANVTYEMFDNQGRPLRARMSITVEEFISDTLVGKILKLSSPDVSKTITVKEGDTLPDLCAQEYGDPTLYTQVAAANQLKNFRKLNPGMQLLFPPITRES